MATFVLNDETQVNSYGFRVLNAGIDLTRFKANPVMLSMHRDWDLAAVIGRWTNIRIEGTKLLADSEFDMDDKDAAKIAGKVKRGFLKACSMGFLFNRTYMIVNELDGIRDLEKSELMEASIVAVGSNAKSLVRLYAADTEELMTEDQIKLALAAQSEVPVQQNSNTDTMEKFKLNAGNTALLMSLGGLTSTEDAEAINLAIASVCKKLSTSEDALKKEKAEHDKVKETLSIAAKAEATTDVEAAVEAGKLTAAEKNDWIDDYVANPARTKRALSALMGTVKLGKEVEKTASDSEKLETLEEFQKLKIDAQLAFKADYPDDYNAFFA